MLRRDWFDFTAIVGRLLSWVGGEKDGGGEGRGGEERGKKEGGGFEYLGAKVFE